MARILGAALSVAIVILSSTSNIAAAGNITYLVKRSSGFRAFLNGTITTNGKLGAITSQDIVAWQFTYSFRFGNFLEGIVSSTSPYATVFATSDSDLTASDTELRFNFEATNNGRFVFNLAAPSVDRSEYYLQSRSSDGLSQGQGGWFGPIGTGGGLETPVGNVLIRTAVEAVPEPTSMALVGVSFLAITGIRRFNCYASRLLR